MARQIDNHNSKKSKILGAGCFPEDLYLEVLQKYSDKLTLFNATILWESQYSNGP